ncbi:hypothetical protein C5167_034445 [Papaver somniferum]|uniref:Retinoblastoma-associated protein A-box domain-containing protein n=1 Tax=Papaver somniferum TaxID=3469 RepID=A0A4Y7KCZ9_PAPSO|nr:hypothetical protein C5167_034445 [Papaver somniferum]
MLACSAELVLATHKTVTMLFPAVLERTGITVFDLSKVIEIFIRHEESLSERVEETSKYFGGTVFGEHGQKEEMMSPKRVCGEYRNALVERNSFRSPLKGRPNRSNPGGGGETCAETGINVFFSKVFVVDPKQHISGLDFDPSKYAPKFRVLNVGFVPFLRPGADKIYNVFNNQLPVALKILKFDKQLAMENV